jgi:hypothetical protein
VANSWPPAWLTPVPEDAILRGDGRYAAQFAEFFGSIGKDGIAGKAGEALPQTKEGIQKLYTIKGQLHTCFVYKEGVLIDEYRI